MHKQYFEIFVLLFFMVLILYMVPQMILRTLYQKLWGNMKLAM